MASPIPHQSLKSFLEDSLPRYFQRKPNQEIIMDQSQNVSYQAGQTKGQAQEKGSQMMDRAGNAAQSARDSMQEAGSQVKAKAQGAADAVKNATGMNK